MPTMRSKMLRAAMLLVAARDLLDLMPARLIPTMADSIREVAESVGIDANTANVACLAYKTALRQVARGRHGWPDRNVAALALTTAEEGLRARMKGA